MVTIAMPLKSFSYTVSALNSTMAVPTTKESSSLLGPSFEFMSMLIGLIDGDGYFRIGERINKKGTEFSTISIYLSSITYYLLLLFNSLLDIFLVLYLYIPTSSSSKTRAL